MEERGFSFLEAMIVMAVAGLLLTAAVPKIADLDRFAVDKEILQMVGDIRYIQSKSYSYFYDKQSVSLSRTEAPRIRLGPEKSNADYYLISKATKVYKQQWIPKGMDIYMNRLPVMFYRNGGSTAGTITVKKGDYRRYIIIDRVGRVRISNTRP